MKAAKAKLSRTLKLRRRTTKSRKTEMNDIDLIARRYTEVLRLRAKITEVEGRINRAG